MSARGNMLRRLAQLELEQVEVNVVSTFAEGPDGQLWLTLQDGRTFRDAEALAMLEHVTWPEPGGITHLMGLDLDVMLGLKPELSDEELERMQEKRRTMVSVLDRLGIRKRQAEWGASTTS